MRPTLSIQSLTPELRALERAASQANGHSAPLATHAFLRSGEVVGATALFAPCLTFWAHSEKLHARESFELIRRVRSVATSTVPSYITLCCLDSPFYPFMTKLGFTRLGNADVFQG